MYKIQGVLVLIVLYIAFAHSLSWDIVVARSNKLEFYNEGTLVYRATPAVHRINWISYDPVHNRILFADQNNEDNSASSFDIATKKTQSLIKKIGNRYLTRFAYDSATEILFGTDKNKLYSFSMKPACNNEVDGHLVIDFETVVLREVAVDSCRGYIYWIADNIVGRARIDGSEQEVIVEGDGMVKQGITIGADKVYWIESHEYNNGAFRIQSADLNGHNIRTLYKDTESDSSANKLTISNGFISWGNNIENFYWQLPRNSPNATEMKPNKILMTTTIPSCGSQDIAANYKITNCLNAYIDENLFCVNGTKVSEELRCECDQGYTGERCDVSVCHNYCLQGDCSVSPHGHPNCRCNVGYAGDRCDISICQNYCFQGECSIIDGEPSCRCNAGYSGKRCEVYVCGDYCLHNGVCSINYNNEPVCHCARPYSGRRCTVLYKGYHWLPLVHGHLPPNAIVGGFENEDIYIARAYHSGSLCPGKYVKSVGKAYIPWGGGEHSKTEDFEILCGFNATWVKVESNNIPKNAFIGGRTGGSAEVGGEPLYVGRAEVENHLICGKAYARTQQCYLPYRGREVTTSSYEILVVPDYEKDQELPEDISSH